ncbi:MULTISPECIES: class I SAM-dependent methyltransferase [unclassified Bizionia]|uniref:class I SAM-dependent methyltransferase n=1 Tax=unclassified Bizionia TaxID=2626393 RepID=UPI0020663BA3|nr:methyltransferase domain-containing protein [Bizionia sp. M204]UPS91664.1 methyltransferase domain-containing protein [Bizionia sp. M204]
MTSYEFMRWLTFPLMTTHLVTVRNDLKRLLKSGVSTGKPLSILDVGGRKSPYTINLPAAVTLLDVPQEAGTKEALNLGFTDSILTTIQKKRSNITDVIIQDMTQSTLPDYSYDAVVSIEVIEHVEADDLFVKHIAQVIKKGGWAYFTTPNGDFIKNEGPGKNPDHVRHYTRQELQDLLSLYFETVDVHYAVSTGKYRVWSLQSLKSSNPVRIMKSLLGTVVNRFQSKGVETRKEHTAHLVAVAYK